MSHNKRIILIFTAILPLLAHTIGCGNSGNADSGTGAGTGDNGNQIGNTPDFEIEKTGQDGTSISTNRFITYEIGESVSGIPITAVEAGTGSQTGLVLIGAIHGNESNTALLVKALSASFTASPALIPGHIRLFFLPELNPDGLMKKTRDNARRVDLNRNFPTDDWKKDAVSPSDIRPGSGGESPGSEPEIIALLSWINGTVKKKVASVYLISFHAAYPPTGSVQPGYRVYGIPDEESGRFAQSIAGLSGFRYIKTWVTAKPLTGEFIHWCGANRISCCDIELPDYKPPDAIPAGKKESTITLFERVVKEIVSEFIVVQ